MTALDFTISGVEGEEEETVTINVEKMINAGYTGRNQEEVQKHVDELKEKGVPAPERVPAYFPKFNQALVQSDQLQALTADGHWGEAEFVLLCGKNEIFVAAGSDHTDRELEKDDIPRAKQIYPNVISREVWRLSDVKDHWDEIKLKSFIEKEGEKVIFQETRLSALLPPENLLSRIENIIKGGEKEGLVIFSGTVGSEISIDYSPYFEVKLEDPIRDDVLQLSYELEPFDNWYKEEIY